MYKGKVKSALEFGPTDDTSGNLNPINQLFKINLPNSIYRIQ